jgi:hypothetical protein
MSYSIKKGVVYEKNSASVFFVVLAVGSGSFLYSRLADRF